MNTQQQKEELTREAYVEYKKIRDQAFVEYDKIRAQAEVEYEKIRDTAYAEYEKINDPAYVEYDKIRDPAWAIKESMAEEKMRAINAANAKPRAKHRENTPAPLSILLLCWVLCLCWESHLRSSVLLFLLGVGI